MGGAVRPTVTGARLVYTWHKMLSKHPLPLTKIHFVPHIMLKHIFVLSAIACLTFSSWAQSGALDADFGSDGLSTPLPQPLFNKAYSVLVQPNHKILLAGYSLSGAANVFSLTQLLPNGDPDITFGNNGFVETPIGANAACYAAVLQSDGKILLAGTATDIQSGASDFAIVRYLPDGAVDSSFAADGIQTISFGTGDELARAIALQPDGKILLAGTATTGNGSLMALARLTEDGQTDITFSGDGRATLAIGAIFTNGFALVLQPDGKIILAGNAKFGMADDVALARFLSNGNLDISFGNAGYLTTNLGSDADSGNALAIQPDGKILVAGITGNTRDFVLLRYAATGILDQSFGTQGVVTTDFFGGDDYANAILLQPDGKIILGGYAYIGTLPDFALARYENNGDLDADFGDAGLVTTDFDSSYDYGFPLSFQPDGKLLLGGYSFSSGHTSFALARYISGLNVGVVDFSQKISGLIAPNPVGEQAVFEFELLQPGLCSLLLLDAQGRLVQTFFNNKRIGVGKQSEVLAFRSNLPAGWYLLRLDDGGRQLTVRVLKD